MGVLTCPNCASRFRSAEAPGAGTAVRKCSQCGHVFVGAGAPGGSDDLADLLPELPSLDAPAESDDGEFTALGTAIDGKAFNQDLGSGATLSLVIDSHEQPITGFRTTLGRRNADIVINDPDVSRQHAQIENYEGRYLLKDLESSNGTYLNGKRVVVEFLSDGDELRLGSTLIRVRLP